MSDDKKIHLLPDVRDLRKAAIEDLRRQYSELKEYALVVAEIRKASYDAHLEQGFTPEQALELCKSLEI